VTRKLCAPVFREMKGTLPHLATKEDVRELNGALPHLAAKEDVRELHGVLPYLAMNADIGALETRQMRWFIGTVFTCTALAFSIAKFFS
jgi:hypothetical protein